MVYTGEWEREKKYEEEEEEVPSVHFHNDWVFLSCVKLEGRGMRTFRQHVALDTE